MAANSPTLARQTLCADASCPLAEDHVQGSPGCSFASPTPAPVEGLVAMRLAVREAFTFASVMDAQGEALIEVIAQRTLAALKPTGDRGELVERLTKLLAAATETSPPFNDPDHRYWLNRINRARIDLVGEVPSILATLKPTGDMGELVEVEKLVRELHEDADAWMAGDVERDNEVAGLLSYNAARQIEECAARITADAALIEAKETERAEQWRLRREALSTLNVEKAVAETLRAKLAEARAALEPFAKAVEAIDKHDPDFPENGAALRASFDFWSTEGTRRCVTFGDLRHAAKQFATLAKIDGTATPSDGEAK